MPSASNYLKSNQICLIFLQPALFIIQIVIAGISNIGNHAIARELAHNPRFTRKWGVGIKPKQKEPKQKAGLVTRLLF
jgi:hypothetical protein